MIGADSALPSHISIASSGVLLVLSYTTLKLCRRCCRIRTQAQVFVILVGPRRMEIAFFTRLIHNFDNTRIQKNMVVKVFFPFHNCKNAVKKLHTRSLELPSVHPIAILAAMSAWLLVIVVRFLDSLPGDGLLVGTG